MNNATPKILFAGDVMLGENIYHFGRSIRTRFNTQYKNLIPDHVSNKLFSNIDAFFFNFEYSLMPDDYTFQEIDKSIYVAPTNSLNTFPGGFLKIANIANNHFAQHGLDRTSYTIRTLKENNYVVVGENNKPVKVTIAGYNLFLWGVTLINSDQGIFCSSYEKVIDDIELPGQKTEGDFWMISVHWGTEYMPYPDKEQRKLANELANLGFDIIYGHHPHVFQPFEWIRSTLVMYSLGNFIFDQNFSHKTREAVLPLVAICQNQLKLEAYKVKSSGYQPKSVKKVKLIDWLMIKEKPYLTGLKKKIINHKYRALVKLEYLPYIAKSNFLVLRYLFKRYKSH